MTDGLTLIAALLRAANIADASFVEAMGTQNATTREMQVLAAIAAGEQPNQTRICELTGIDRSALSVICRRLAKKGWIARRHSRRDSRAYAMTVSPEGHAVLVCARAAADGAVSLVRENIAGVGQLRIIEQSHKPSGAPVKRGHARRSIPRQLEVLAAIAASADLCQRDLSDMMDLDRSTISVICKALADNGWVKRRRTAEDARAYNMAVTSKGRAVLASAGVVADPCGAQRHQPHTGH